MSECDREHKLLKGTSLLSPFLAHSTVIAISCTKTFHNFFYVEASIILQVSRLVVEMMKREWPQQWPGLLEELHLLSKRGPTQTELVLFVFLRIAEDVATLQVWNTQ